MYESFELNVSLVFFDQLENFQGRQLYSRALSALNDVVEQPILPLLPILRIVRFIDTFHVRWLGWSSVRSEMFSTP